MHEKYGFDIRGIDTQRNGEFGHVWVLCSAEKNISLDIRGRHHQDLIVKLANPNSSSKPRDVKPNDLKEIIDKNDDERELSKELINEINTITQKIIHTHEQFQDLYDYKEQNRQTTLLENCLNTASQKN